MKIAADSNPEDDARLDLTPLIDVVFQLLIFFMVTMSFVKNREYLLPIDLAEAGAAEDTQESTFTGMTLTVLADGKVVLDGDETVTDDDVKTRLDDLYARDPSAPILLRGDENASHGRVLSLLDLVKQTGFVHVDMIVTKFIQ